MNDYAKAGSDPGLLLTPKRRLSHLKICGSPPRKPTHPDLALLCRTNYLAPLIANLDVFEDESSLRNHLFYLMPDTSSGELRCFFYLEYNLFAKESNGDLILLESSPHLFAL